ncbi:Oxysterol-binding protein-related protein 1C [Platanthera guangdongensis]|uniref:Oxysterol-binding protein-related protein 1C n=1 Tax=Platanthera guangdongensis TaxID=2320717 RepID=A0ABR2MPU9_9ASPA
MHPLCCASPVPVSPTGASSVPPPTQPSFPPPPTPPARPDHPLHHCSTPTSTTAGFRWTSRATFSSDFTSMRPSIHDAAELRLNDIVGGGIAGILYKWVNYGRGWRPRWFVLLDGVLSYYKIYGSHRIHLEEEADKGSMIIGDDSLRLLNRRRQSGSDFLNSPQRKPIGELHLKVATVRETKSDDRRFSIFTGTKKLHLRAETREDRTAWMEALQAVKEMFPRISNSELMAPVDNFVVSTEKLRLRLQEEGVSEAAILDSEQIVRCEFSGLQRQLAIFKQKQYLLIETLRQLEHHNVIYRISEKLKMVLTLALTSFQPELFLHSQRGTKGYEGSRSEQKGSQKEIAEKRILQIRLSKGPSSDGGGGPARSALPVEAVTFACPEHLVIAASVPSLPTQLQLAATWVAATSDCYLWPLFKNTSFVAQSVAGEHRSSRLNHRKWGALLFSKPTKTDLASFVLRGDNFKRK